VHRREKLLWAVAKIIRGVHPAYPLMDSLTAALLTVVGLAAGFVDSVAGGGGLITMPALLWLGLPVHQTMGTNKLQASCGTVLAVIRYARAGLLRWSELRVTVAVTFGFALLGSWAVTLVSPVLLKQLVPWMLLAIAVYVLCHPRFGLEARAAVLGATAFAWIGGAALGFYDGFFGPGTGTLWTAALLGLRGLELTRATAFTKVVNLTSNVASLGVFLWAGHVRFDFAACMIVGQLIGARLGSGMVIKHGAGFVRVVFLGVVFALVAKLLWDQWA
jgi:uncharacterized protein